MITSIFMRHNSRQLSKILNYKSGKHSTFVPKIDDINYHCDQKGTKALVFVLGWTGCKEKNLTKYSEIYEKKEFHVIQYCPSLRITYGVNPKKNLLSQSQLLLDELFRKDLQHLPLYFHNLSNGGVYMYYTLLRQFREKGFVNFNMAGTIFDSSPAPNDPSMAYNAAYAISTGNEVTKIAIGSVAGLWSLFIPTVNALRAYAKGMHRDIENFRNYVPEQLARLPRNEPQHFMYSQADEIIPTQGIEWFIEERRKMGVRVSVTKFQDSGHVKHILKYPNEYRSSLENFLDFCKKRNDAVSRQDSSRTESQVP